jgi:hypothetical protein
MSRWRTCQFGSNSSQFVLACHRPFIARSSQPHVISVRVIDKRVNEVQSLKVGSLSAHLERRGNSGKKGSGRPQMTGSRLCQGNPAAFVVRARGFFAPKHRPTRLPPRFSAAALEVIRIAAPP